MIEYASREYQEKRNYIRMKINAPAAITLVANGVSLTGLCSDLSGGGMLIEIDEVLPVGTETEITISSAHGHSPMLKARATVMRIISQPDANGQPCRLGMEIVEVLN